MSGDEIRSLRRRWELILLCGLLRRARILCGVTDITVCIIGTFGYFFREYRIIFVSQLRAISIEQQSVSVIFLEKT